jgi:hypothetical protein
MRGATREGMHEYHWHAAGTAVVDVEKTCRAWDLSHRMLLPFESCATGSQEYDQGENRATVHPLDP